MERKRAKVWDTRVMVCGGKASSPLLGPDDDEDEEDVVRASNSEMAARSR